MQIQSLEAYKSAYQKSIENPESFWHEIAQNFNWQTPYQKVLDWDFKNPNIKWFIDGRLNITENCIDRHLARHAEKTAYIFECNENNQAAQYITYQKLHDEVCRLANLLKSLNIQLGDRVCIYMPMIPQAIYAMLACARIGAIHSVVFAGFSAKALQERINDSQCKMILTVDTAYRGAKKIDIKSMVNQALPNCRSIEKVLIYPCDEQNPNQNLSAHELNWQTQVNQQSNICPPTYVDSEHPLFILYTSGSTGKPKGVVHSCGGYMVYTCYSFLNVFQYQAQQIYFCTADVGWITGHSYTVYGPLLAAATSVIFEGIPTYPDAGRFWQIIDKHQVNIFYTAPTAIRALEAAGLDFVKPYQLDSLQVLGSVGEPLNEEAWHWYHQNIGKSRCPIVDTWWQTETGGILIAPLAGITKTKPTFATRPLPGVQPVLVDEKGQIIEGNDVEGNLCMRFPWPSMLRTTYGDHQRCQQTYFSTYPDLYFTGDGCRRDADGYYKITGRVDDVMNISGHRIGTAEVENAINGHPWVVESAVVGFAHAIKGQAIYAYCILGDDLNSTSNLNLKNNSLEKLRAEISSCVIKTIGPIAKPDKIQIVKALPKTRSGKIMRRILRKIAEGDFQNLGDTSTLLDPSVVDDIIKERVT